MKSLPRKLDILTRDPLDTIHTRVMEWARDVREAFARIPDVSFVTVDVPASAGVSVAIGNGQQPQSVSIARVITGTTSAAPGIVWAPTKGGFTVTALYGFSGAARLSLRVEV